MIVVTGARGNIGRPLTSLLATAGLPTRIVVRASDAPGPLAPGQEVVVADLDRPQTLDAALTGATHLFLLSPGPDGPHQDAGAVAAAQRAGVRHVVLLSSLGVERGGIGGGEAHAPGDELLRASDLEWTVLRPSEFMTNTRWWLPEITARGTISVPTGGGKVGFVDPADIAAVAFAALTAPGHTGQIYRLTGPEALSTDEIAAQLSTVLGRAVQHVNVPADQWPAMARASGLPEAQVNTLAPYYAGVAAGQMDIVTPDVAQVTGQRPRAFLDWARATLAP